MAGWVAVRTTNGIFICRQQCAYMFVYSPQVIASTTDWVRCEVRKWATARVYLNKISGVLISASHFKYSSHKNRFSSAEGYPLCALFCWLTFSQSSSVVLVLLLFWQRIHHPKGCRHVECQTSASWIVAIFLLNFPTCHTYNFKKNIEEGADIQINKQMKNLII